MLDLEKKIVWLICRADLELYKEIFGETTLKSKGISRVEHIGESTRLENSEEDKMDAKRKEAKIKVSRRSYEKLSNIKDRKTTKNKLVTKALWVETKVLYGLY